MLRFLTLLAASASAALWSGCVNQSEAADQMKPLKEPKVHLVGRVAGSSYISTGGHFTVPFPVSPEVHGRIIFDNSQSVTFHDNWGSRISFSSQPVAENSPMMKVLETKGREQALDTLAKDIYGNLIQPHFHAGVLGGTVSFIYLRPVGPETGVAAFVHGNRIYMVDTDLVPGVEVLAGSDNASQEAHDKWLENHAVELLQTMEIK
jgi:hypothetical protein